MDDYLPLVVMLVLAVGFVILSLTITRLLAPSRPTSAKLAPYESGIIPSREPPERFPVRFYLVAMTFIIVDIEIIFLFPWAVSYRDLGAFGLWAMAIFVVVFILSLVWEISEGALDWGPMKRLQPMGPMTDPERTTDSTIRRVGLEGRGYDGDRGEAA